MAIFNRGIDAYKDYDSDVNHSDNNLPTPIKNSSNGIRYLKSSPTYSKYYGDKNSASEGMLVPSLRTQRPNMTPYIHAETSNISFLKMHDLLERLGIENNAFFLALYDRRLLDVDPYDPGLTMEEKLMVAHECKNNFWYFAREVVRIPSAGSKLGIGGGVPYELNRGNLAISFCFLNNYKFWAELPRQTGKTFALVIIYLWLHNFGTTSSEFLFMNKSHPDSKNNLKRVKDVRELIPEYLQFIKVTSDDGRTTENPNNIEYIENRLTKNKIVTKPSASSKDAANNLGRGMTQPSQWFDEFAWLDWNITIFDAATPANSKASEEAGKNGKPYGQAITTTPGDLESACGKEAHAMQQQCARFSEILYDWTPNKRDKYIKKNSRNNFLFIRFHWYQLGRDKRWFDEQVRSLGFRWVTIRREVLLEWINASSNSIFDQEEIMELRECVREPIQEIRFLDYYILDVYDTPDHNFKSIVSVDVATGVSEDSSAITVINSRTFMPIAHFNSNAIDITELTKLIIEIATKFCPNCVIAPERNGAGEGLISNLRHSPVKNKLYFEYKKTGSSNDVRLKGGFTQQDPKNKISYGVWNDGITRNEIIELLYILVKKHKKKFVIDKIVSEVSTLIQKNGKVDHDVGCHDDSIFSWLIGMWVLIYGKNLNNFGIFKFELDDVDPEELRRRSEEAKANHESFMQLEYIDNLENIEDNLSYQIIKTASQKKDMKDYYKELENERRKLQNEGNTVEPNNSFNQFTFDSEFFNMMNE